MKSSKLVIIVPLLVASLVVLGVFGVKYVTQSGAKTAVANPTPATLPLLKEPTGKPQVGFDKIQSTKPVSDLRKELDASKDSGTSDIDSLAADASAL